jgi:uncharacterized protein YacL
MEKLVALALTTLVSAFVGSYLAGYLKKKGENLATKEDTQNLAHQTALLTETAKEIEAKITDKVWNRQERCELKRDQILLVSERAAALKNSLVNLEGVMQTYVEVAKSEGKPQSTAALSDAALKWNVAGDELERATVTVSLVCG